MSRVFNIFMWCFALVAVIHGQSWTCGSGSCTTTGSVGIGTTSPTQALSVGSSNQFTVSSGGAIVTNGGISSSQSATSERFGLNSTAGSTGSVAVGYNAHADYDASVAIGRSAAAVAENSVQIGYFATAAADGTAVGWGAQALTGGAGTALGFSASASGNASIAIGMSSSAAGHGAALLGFGSSAGGEYSIGAGYGANAQGGGSLALGGFATTHSMDSGSVAVGYGATTTAPNQLVVGGSTLYINDIYFGGGVVSTNPPAPVTINSNGASGSNISGSYLALAAGKATGTAPGGDLVFETSDPTSSGTTLQSLSTKMIVKDNGNVGIGTTAPSSKLAVNGTITTKEVVVTGSGWSDYVFDAGYALPSLSEVAAFVEQNHHLVGIPSAQEVSEQGISLGDMQAKLLAKIEELTLQLIATEKRVRELERREGTAEQGQAQGAPK